MFSPVRSYQSHSPGRAAEAAGPVSISITHRLSSPHQLSCFLYIYNTVRPAVRIQKRIYRGNQAVFESEPEALEEQKPVNTAPIFYSGSASLEGMPPGAYTLEIIATDRLVNASASQRVYFWIQ